MQYRASRWNLKSSILNEKNEVFFCLRARARPPGAAAGGKCERGDVLRDGAAAQKKTSFFSFKIEDFKFVAEGSYLSVDQGERVEICARRVVLEAGKAWVAARKEGDSALLWLDLADAGV